MDKLSGIIGNLSQPVFHHENRSEQFDYQGKRWPETTPEDTEAEETFQQMIGEKETDIRTQRKPKNATKDKLEEQEEY